jgi:hypothetical protein
VSNTNSNKIYNKFKPKLTWNKYKTGYAKDWAGVKEHVTQHMLLGAACAIFGEIDG